MINTTKSITIELPKPLHEIIIDVVCGYYGMSKDELFHPRREQVQVDRRYILFYIIHIETGMSNTELSQLVGVGRRIVQHGIDKVTGERYIYKNKYSHDIEVITKSVHNMFSPIKDWIAPKIQ